MSNSIPVTPKISTRSQTGPDLPADAADALSSPGFGMAEYQQYMDDLGQFAQMAPGLQEQAFSTARGSLERSERTGARRMQQEAARGMAAAMGGAGQMATGGGRAASLRQSGLDFGRSAADFAAQAAQRAADLEVQRLGSEMQLYGETLPGVSLAKAEAAGVMEDMRRAPMRELAWAQQQIANINDSLWWDDERAAAIAPYLTVLTPGSPAYRAIEGYLQQLGAYGAAGIQAARLGMYGET